MSKNTTVIHRTKKINNFTVLNNSMINDSRLKYCDIGVMSYLLSKPDNWIINQENVEKTHGDGRMAIRSSFVRLMDSGYITRDKVSNADGTYYWSYNLFDASDTKSGEISEFNQGSVSAGGKPPVVSNPLDNTKKIILNNKEDKKEKKPINDTLEPLNTSLDNKPNLLPLSNDPIPEAPQTTSSTNIDDRFTIDDSGMMETVIVDGIILNPIYLVSKLDTIPERFRQCYFVGGPNDTLLYFRKPLANTSITWKKQSPSTNPIPNPITSQELLDIKSQHPYSPNNKYAVSNAIKDIVKAKMPNQHLDDYYWNKFRTISWDCKDKYELFAERLNTMIVDAYTNTDSNEGF